MNTYPQAVNVEMRKLLTITHIVYALHAFAVVSAILGSATIIFSFLASIPSLIAVGINYFKRSDVRGTWLESHFVWQIRTFWFTALWAVIGVVLILTVIGVLFGLLVLGVLSIWVVYRIARGWWGLAHGEVLPMPPA
jgi:uncharacterized membrane protein